MNYKTNDPTNEKHTSSKTPPSPPQEDSEENFKPALQYPGGEFKSEGFQSHDIGKDSDDGDRNKTRGMTRR